MKPGMRTFFSMKAKIRFTLKAEMAYSAVTGLYFISAFAVNRVAAFIEKRMRVPGMIGSAK